VAEVGASEAAGVRPRARMSRLIGWLSNPAWARAPFLLRRYPGLLAAVFGAGFVLALVSASPPLFVSSAENQALHASIAKLCPWTVGYAVGAYQPLTPVIPIQPGGGGAFGGGAGGGGSITGEQLFDTRNSAVNHSVQGISRLGPGVVTIFGSTAQAFNPRASRTAPLVRLITRDGFESHITPLQRGTGPGVWLPDDTAKFLKVRPDDPIVLNIAGKTARTRVAGIYRSLISQPPATFWCSQTTVVYGLDPNSAPPALLLTDRRTLFDLSTTLQDGNASVSWEYPVRAKNMTFPEAQTLAAQINHAQLTLPSFGGGAFSAPPRISQIESVVPQVASTINQIRSPAFSVALAGRLVALLVLGAVGFYWLDRRRREAALYSAKGVGPFAIASKAVLEMLIPLAVASAAGWFAAVWLVRWLGPGSLLSATAPRSAAQAVVWTALVGLLLLAAAVAVAVRAAEGGALGAKVVARTPWDLVILVLMGASLYEMLTRGGGTVVTTTGQTTVDILLILFPILFVGGASALAARFLRRILPRLRRFGTRRSPAIFLATRRLTAASGIALSLIVAVALAVGILAYAATLSTSTQASADAKAKVFVGNEVRATLLIGASAPASLVPTTTNILEQDGVALQPGEQTVTLLEVDPATFARGAFWDRSFAKESLSELMNALRAKSGNGLPAIVVGGSVPPSGAVKFARTNDVYRYHVTASADAFPLQTQNQTFLVVDASRVQRERKDAVSYLVGSGELGPFTRALSRADTPFRSPVSADQVRNAPTAIALTWLYDYLLAMGIVTGLIVLAALVMYLAARQRGRVVSYALARRMGLRASQHRRSLLYEVAGMLTIGVLLGAGFAAIGARLVTSKLDPLPNLPPPALFRLPWMLYLATFVVLMAAAWIGARVAQRSAGRANVAEVMRVAA
jgi:putative ABC transport system permease protein